MQVHFETVLLNHKNAMYVIRMPNRTKNVRTAMSTGLKYEVISTIKLAIVRNGGSLKNDSGAT